MRPAARTAQTLVPPPGGCEGDEEDLYLGTDWGSHRPQIHENAMLTYHSGISPPPASESTRGARSEDTALPAGPTFTGDVRVREKEKRLSSEGRTSERGLLLQTDKCGTKGGRAKILRSRARGMKAKTQAHQEQPATGSSRATSSSCDGIQGGDPSTADAPGAGGEGSFKGSGSDVMSLLLKVCVPRRRGGTRDEPRARRLPKQGSQVCPFLTAP